MWMQHYRAEYHHSKLWPLMPRLATAMQTPCRACIHQKTSANNRHQSNRGINAEPLVTSPRWNPTAEQVAALREMYRRGITTPSAQQIQQIVANLRRYGKIEGKNVFYWFQNHKARERQKKRVQQQVSMHRAGVAELHQTVEKTEIHSDQENCLNISTSQPLPKENSTLELFPFPVGGNQDTRVIPNKFFEFLPLKN